MRRQFYKTSLGDRRLVKSSHALAILFVLVFVSYFNSLFNPFIWDDKMLILENQGIMEGFSSVIRAFSPTLWGLRADEEAFQSFYRPFHTILSIIDYNIWGLKPFGYHLSNTIIHFINTVLLYYFATRLTDFRLAPLIAAALFAVHPIHTEPVSFISSRPDLLSAMFLLASFHMYALSVGPRELFTQKKVLSPAYILSLFLFLCALLSKEMALTLPLLVALYAVLYEEPGARLKRVVPFFILLALYLGFRVYAMSEFVELHSTRVGFTTLILTASTAVFDYIRLLVIPFPLKAYHPLVWHNGLSLKVFFSFVLILASAFTAVWLVLRGSRAAAFSLIWTYITLMPVLNIGTLGEFSIAERYLYTPSIGFAILFAVTVTAVRRKSGALKQLVPYATVCVLSVCVFLTFMRNRVWSDEVVFFEAMVKGSQSSVLPHANLAYAYTQAGRNTEAIRELEIAAELSGGNPVLYYELASLLVREKRYREAVVPLEKAVEFRPGYVAAYNTLGITMAELGRMEEAVQYFAKALELDPGSEAAARNLEKARRSLNE